MRGPRPFRIFLMVILALTPLAQAFWLAWVLRVIGAVAWPAPRVLLQDLWGVAVLVVLAAGGEPSSMLSGIEGLVRRERSSGNPQPVSPTRSTRVYSAVARGLTRTRPVLLSGKACWKQLVSSSCGRRPQGVAVSRPTQTSSISVSSARRAGSTASVRAGSSVRRAAYCAGLIRATSPVCWIRAASVVIRSVIARALLSYVPILPARQVDVLVPAPLRFVKDLGP